MDSYGFIDSTIQVHNPNAVAGYNRFDNISKMLTLLEVFLAVAFISWSYSSTSLISTVFKASAEYLFAYSSLAMNQHVVFLVGNLIVVVCYVLSGHTEIGNESVGPEVPEHNSNSNSNNTTNTNTTTTNNNNNNNKHKFEESCKTSEAGSNIEPVKKEMEAETVIKEATKQIERFQRTQSVKLRREMSMKPHGKLRRSVSERRTTFETVERLSNEEFRLTVEAFISNQQRIRKQQIMVEESYYL